jgi:hypothetical protein
LGAPALRAVATLRGSLSLGPFGSGPAGHRSTSLALRLRRFCLNYDSCDFMIHVKGKPIVCHHKNQINHKHHSSDRIEQRRGAPAGAPSKIFRPGHNPKKKFSRVYNQRAKK